MPWQNTLSVVICLIAATVHFSFWVVPLQGLAETVAPAAAGLSDSDRKAMAWFDTLGFPSLAGKRCVRVSTGEFRESDDCIPINRFQLGFLLEEKGNEFKVFSPNRLMTLTYKRTPRGTPEYRCVGYVE